MEKKRKRLQRKEKKDNKKKVTAIVKTKKKRVFNELIRGQSQIKIRIVLFLDFFSVFLKNKMFSYSVFRGGSFKATFKINSEHLCQSYGLFF